MTLNNAYNNSVTNVYPLELGSSEIVFDNEDTASAVSLDELQDFGQQSSSVTPAAINIENSTDVIIGPVTQFHGPVTIYQNVIPPSATVENGNSGKYVLQNEKLMKSESASSEPSHPVNTSKANCDLSNKYVRCGIPIICTLLIVIIITSSLLLSTKPTSSFTPSANDKEEEQEKPLDDPLGAGVLVARNYWGANSPLNVTPISHPVPYVIVGHTVTPNCTTFQECSKRVKSIQEYHMNRQFIDVAYNFLIGGDANAYVGRGWDYKNSERKNSIIISFIGNYIKDKLTDGMIETAKALLNMGVKKGKLDKDYKLVCHSQVYPTDSPGKNVEEVIKKWPHFYSQAIGD